MSTLFPQLVHFGQRHYRKNPSRHLINQVSHQSVGHLDETIHESFSPTVVEEANGENIDVVQATDGSYRGQVVIPILFHGFVVGFKHSVLHKIETDFECRVKMPPKSSKSHTIIIQGSTANDVLRACQRIKWICSTSRSKCRPNNFVCLPANLPNIQQRFRDFRQAILSLVNSSDHVDFRGIESKLFVNPNLLHFTMAVMVLADDSEIAEAVELLRSYVQSEDTLSIFAGGPLKLTIKGLEYMNDDPSAVHVLYAKVEDSPDKERLQQISNAVADLFDKHGFCSNSNNWLHGDDVKLHMTLMNSKLRSSINDLPGEGDENGEQSGRRAFSIVGIREKFNDFCFAEDQLFDTVTLCAMRSLSGADHFYTTFCQVKLAEGKVPYCTVTTGDTMT